ncbi:hypothetical protein EUGRSUZ_L03708 [Eucalyptus grandis]|uniref:Uncharacterized protein n=1 Tax=Eucalyptus grandis TaxID=71139 RepID=A0AAD9T6C4_EUCGR|nr:hypothetical protein EUGRSUZ_L03708 [Eucalyptus grandis]
MFWFRDICTHTGSATMCGHSFYKVLPLRMRTLRKRSVGLRSSHATQSCSLSDFRVPVAWFDSRDFIMAGDEVFFASLLS